MRWVDHIQIQWSQQNECEAGPKNLQGANKAEEKGPTCLADSRKTWWGSCEVQAGTKPKNFYQTVLKH